MENNKILKNFLKWHFLEESLMVIQAKLMKNLIKENLTIKTTIGVKNIREVCIQRMMKCGLI